MIAEEPPIRYDSAYMCSQGIWIARILSAVPSKYDLWIKSYERSDWASSDFPYKSSFQ